MTNLRAVLALSRRDKGAVLRYGLVAVAIEVGLRTTTLPRLCRLLRINLDTSHSSGQSGSSTDARLSDDEIRRLTLASRILRRRPFDDTCLRRAMFGAWILRSRAHVIRIGVVKSDGVVRAHAWLELDGVSLEPDAVTAFKPLTALGGTLAA